MSQVAKYELSGPPMNFGDIALEINAMFAAVASQNRDATAPDEPFTGMFWIDTSADPIETLKMYINSSWTSLISVNNTTGVITRLFGILDEDTMASDSAVLPPSQQSVKAYVDTNAGRISNLKPTVNVAVNKLDIFTKSGGAAPDSTNIIRVAIPDGNGHTLRSRAAAYLSGTGQIILADAGNYWSKGSLDGEIKTAWLYAIWDGTGIVWALGGYSGFNKVSTTTTVTDDDYLLLEASSTYSRSASHYCVAVAKIRYQYDTADTPDHTIQATVEDAPQVIWNPKSDYNGSSYLATSVVSAGDIAETGVVSKVVKQTGKYLIIGNITFNTDNSNAHLAKMYIKTGHATYGSATARIHYPGNSISNSVGSTGGPCTVYLNNGDTIHLGGSVTAAAGNRGIVGTANSYYTGIVFRRID